MSHSFYRRDIEHRGRSFTSVREQYYRTVRPMHMAYVEPCKRWADLILPEGGENRVALDVLLGKLGRAAFGTLLRLLAIQSASRGPLIAVTGGAGFIGSHTIDRLIEAGCRVVVLDDDFSTGKRANLAQWASDPRLMILEVDIADGIFAPLASITRQHISEVSRIIRLAAQTSVVRSVQNPLQDVRVKRRHGAGAGVRAQPGSRRWCWRRRPPCTATSPSCRETATLHPLSPYGIDKLGGEHFLHYYSAVHEVPGTARCASSMSMGRAGSGAPTRA